MIVRMRMFFLSVLMLVICNLGYGSIPRLPSEVGMIVQAQYIVEGQFIDNSSFSISTFIKGEEFPQKEIAISGIKEDDLRFITDKKCLVLGSYDKVSKRFVIQWSLFSIWPLWGKSRIHPSHKY